MFTLMGNGSEGLGLVSTCFFFSLFNGLEILFH